MSTTIVDMPKVAQMLDNGWQVTLWKNPLSTYTAQGTHENLSAWNRAKSLCLEQMSKSISEMEAKVINEADFCVKGVIDTDDFTPEQALTRLAYKVHGEII